MPNIVISYRRGDAAGTVGWIHDKLAQHYGPGAVFRDIDNIEYAKDFRKSIGRAIKRSDVLVAVVGPRWTGKHDDGTSRIQEANDWVRIEIETAMQLDVPIIPLLIEGAKMPPPADLPGTIRELAYLNAMTIDSGTEFHRHIEELIRTINAQAPAHTAPPQPEPSRAAPPRPEPPPQEPPRQEPPPSQQPLLTAPSRNLFQKILKPFPMRSDDSAVAKLMKVVGTVGMYLAYLVIIVIVAEIFGK